MFQSREEAGRLLAESLKGIKGIKREKGVVLAIPRGGVVVGKEIAEELGWPLDVVVVKKIGAPMQQELALGAVAEGEAKVIDWEMALRLGIEQEWLDEEVKSQKSKVKSYVKKFRKGKKLNIKNCKLIILTDDGVATGATMETAIKAVRKIVRTVQTKEETFNIVLAVPVGARETLEKLRKMVDEVVVLEEPEYFAAVGQFYREFPQVTDEEVIKILREK